MPELPDVNLYVEHLRRRVVGDTLEHVRVSSPFLVRSFDPPVSAAEGRRALAARRMGKRIVLGLDGDLWLVIHLMIAGRLRWRERGSKIPGKLGLAAFDFSSGSLILTEASTKKRASLHLVRGEAAMRDIDPGGIEPIECTVQDFATALRGERHTIKRALTDPRLLSGIGNAYSDEILWRARMSPVRMTTAFDDDEIAALHEAMQSVLREWSERLAAEAGDDFPERVTAFREGMAVHGRYRQPCPRCGAPVQRIAYADSESNYCARCQTGGKLLADRSLSRLMHGDWPKTLEELERRKDEAGRGAEGSERTR
ncbi:MAG: DNA-formamidopyrimidine glycosylase family protein [Polyangiaceae bacterium]|jgi:formamidopyrimidine-DNA glycosylase